MEAGTTFEKESMLVGCARVSTVEQNLQLQLDALERAGSAKVFADKLSGSTLQRPGLTEAMNYLREGDCLAVWKLDRLGRTMRGLIDFVDQLQRERINFQSLTDGINTESATGRFFFHLMAALAQMERELLIERTQAGLEFLRSRPCLLETPRNQQVSPQEIVVQAKQSRSFE